jgi:hypothetical protein
MTILEQVRSFQSQGIHCVPVENTITKKPITRNGHWKNVTWTDQDFLNAEAFGIEHEISKILSSSFALADVINKKIKGIINLII